jgi:hypothetical protein
LHTPKKQRTQPLFEVETKARPTTCSFPKNPTIRYAKRYPTQGKWKWNTSDRNVEDRTTGKFGDLSDPHLS